MLYIITEMVIFVVGGTAMAITIGVCDDNPQQVGLLTSFLRSHHRADEFDLITSTSPAEFLALVRNKAPRLVFLDIDMGETSGIQLGEEIKALYQDAVLVFVTAYENYALEAFGVRAFHYLLKPLTRENFDIVLDEALSFIQSAPVKTEKALTVKTKKEVVHLNFSDIVYFEKMGHKVKIHTKERDLYYYDNFTNLLGTIGTADFLQCHQGYIVNVGKIRAFREKTLFLDGDIALPVSRTYMDTVKKMLAQQLFDGEDRS